MFLNRKFFRRQLILAIGDRTLGERSAPVEAAATNIVVHPDRIGRVLELEGLDVGEHVVWERKTKRTVGETKRIFVFEAGTFSAAASCFATMHIYRRRLYNCCVVVGVFCPTLTL